MEPPCNQYCCVVDKGRSKASNTEAALPALWLPGCAERLTVDELVQSRTGMRKDSTFQLCSVATENANGMLLAGPIDSGKKAK